MSAPQGGLRHDGDEANFVIVPRPTVRDERLSWQARGLLMFILDLPAGWEIKASWLAKQGPAGEEAVYTILRELKAAGYYRVERRRGSNGKFISGTAVSKVARPSWAAQYAEEAAARAARRPVPVPTVRVLEDGTIVEEGGQTAITDGSETPPPADLAVGRNRSDREPAAPVTGPTPNGSAGNRLEPSPKEERGGSTNNGTPLPTGGAPAAAEAEDVPQLALVAAPAAPSKNPGRRKTELPEGWEPDEALAAWTREVAPGFPRAELDQFRDWAKSERVLKADWDATWRNSVRRWKERNSRGQRPPGGSRPGPYRDTGWKDGTSQAGWDRFMETGGTDR